MNDIQNAAPRASRSAADADAILRYWHSVEFFIPFDLQQVLEGPDAEWSVRGWRHEDLSAATNTLWKPNLPEDRKLTGFDVYFGVFDRSVLSEVVRRVLTPEQVLDQEERGQLEGLTCVAKIRTGPIGEPLLHNVSVSTAPWALGGIQANGLDALDFDIFEESAASLKLRLGQFRAEQSPRPQNDAAPAAKQPPKPLSAEELHQLLSMFLDWARYPLADTPGGMPVLYTVARTTRKRQEQTREEAPAPLSATPSPPAEADPAKEEEKEEDDADTEIDIDILNSFFARDIARAIHSLENGEDCPALSAYLSPCPNELRIDLDSPGGHARILDTLALDRLPAAHWPDEPEHAMSLMQQFAINDILDEGGDQVLFAVNGPPGTGKTTLLRDVFAELITRRARVLATFRKPKDAFEPGVTDISFHDGPPCKVRRLRSELTGFEMVVASSNNAAVENLSRDLPKTGALGAETWCDGKGVAQVGYLRQVANNLIARNGKGDYVDLKGKDAPWGLIACALGRAANRRDVGNRLRSGGYNNDRKAAKGFHPEQHQSLWQWRDHTAPLYSFAQARAAFHDAEQAVERRRANFSRLVDLHALLLGKTESQFTAEASQQVESARAVCTAARQDLDNIIQEMQRSQAQLGNLCSQAALIEKRRPAWWLIWLPLAGNRQYRLEREQNLRRQQEILEIVFHLQARQPVAEERCRTADESVAAATAALARRQAEWRTLQSEWLGLRRDFPKADFPATAQELDTERWQIDGLWRDPTLSRLRSEVFIAALALHEAWLAEVLQTGGGFGGNAVAVQRLLEGDRLAKRAHALDVWQSLFMIVPVISSTFASIASQFRDLGAASLGWLFVDEAGQAVPQAAVGALWRSRRAVVVGDPLQIEPVFTVPIALSEALAAKAGLSGDAGVAPHQFSAQALADSASPVGTWLKSMAEPLWIGRPLRVHRRCVDPMFTIANQIAYDGTMVFPFGLDDPRRRPPADSLDMGDSAWVSIGGMATDKQVVPEQIELVRRAVHALYEREGRLPDLYIISPFRRIKQALAQAIGTPEAWPRGAMPGKTELRTWTKEKIGTVHTFQGKEQSLVWLVLGCDTATEGGAAWASKKPNLLNVALTRAKHRFFMIGNETVWAKRPYFRTADRAYLPRITPETFLNRARKGS